MTTVEARRRGLRRGIPAVALAIAIPVLAFVVLAGGWLLGTHTEVVGTNSVGSRFAMAGPAPGQKLCTQGLTLPGNANAIRIQIGAARGTPAPSTLRLDAGGQTRVSKATVPAGRFGAVFRFQPIGREAPARWCLTSSRAIVAGLGSASASNYSGITTIDGKGVGLLNVAYLKIPSRSLLAALPAAARHASVFRAGFVGAWTYWLLIPILLLAWIAGLRVLVRGIR